ncbi:MAG: hypothetical protein ICV75_07035 [Nitrospiraceae bacterium]|nr:hypothetical protein [Nitrospiraceae bacterium]
MEHESPRALTHDEQKAAEAAFGGRPFNPAWSASAKKVYDGLTGALPKKPEGSEASAEVDTPQAEDAVTGIDSDAIEESPEEEAGEETPTSRSKLVASRQEAIAAGFLIDVTPDAQKLGLAFPVTITKPLWDVGIAPDQILSEDDKSARLRDVLMAFRLRLAGQGTLSPLIDFPALLELPPGSVPQPVSLFALIQPDEQQRTMVTLLLPNEVSATMLPIN